MDIMGRTGTGLDWSGLTCRLQYMAGRAAAAAAAAVSGGTGIVSNNYRRLSRQSIRPSVHLFVGTCGAGTALLGLPRDIDAADEGFICLINALGKQLDAFAC